MERYLPGVHQRADLIQGGAVWRVEAPAVEDAAGQQVLEQTGGEEAGGGRERSGDVII